MPLFGCSSCKKNFISILLIDVSTASPIWTLPHISCGGHTLFFPKYQPEDPSPSHCSRRRNDVFGCPRAYTSWIDGTKLFFHLCLCHWLSPDLSPRRDTHHSSSRSCPPQSYTRGSSWAFPSCRRRGMDCHICSHSFWWSRYTCVICHRYCPGIKHISGYCYSSGTGFALHRIDASWIRFPEKNSDYSHSYFRSRSTSRFCPLW